MDVEGAEYLVFDELVKSGVACAYTGLGAPQDAARSLSRIPGSHLQGEPPGTREVRRQNVRRRAAGKPRIAVGSWLQVPSQRSRPKQPSGVEAWCRSIIRPVTAPPSLSPRRGRQLGSRTQHAAPGSSEPTSAT
eukprot:scaffold1651_cov317-Pinguiococcus_pyrenoidosus.AAC.3